ncbi:MAG: YcjX family protein [Pseudomonadota bacterium]
MVIGVLADRVGRGIEDATHLVSETFLEPVVRLGVTGLARSGKTVFITSLVANLMDRGRMPGLEAARSGRIRTAYLQPQPDDTVPRFDFEAHKNALLGAEPHWPKSTTQVSELRLSLKVNPKGLLSGLSGPRTIHLDIVDYPGEWLLDLALLDLDFVQWSQAALARAESRPGFDAFSGMLSGAMPEGRLDEETAKALAQAWSAHLQQARAAGYSDCTPGRFLLPGDLAGSPVLTFAPLPPGPAPRGSLAREFARRYEAYKSRIVKPFFRDHFARIDRQIVLVDALGAIHAGPAALADLRQTMAGILGAFRPGTNSFLTALMGRRVERILFAATKADHIHHSQHDRLTAIMQALLREARDRADFAGAETVAMSIAALRATTEESRQIKGREVNLVRGYLQDGGREAALHPGDLPADPMAFLSPAEAGAATWLDAEFDVMRFRPAPLTLRAGEGPPHIRLDAAAEFLLSGKL